MAVASEAAAVAAGSSSGGSGAVSQSTQDQLDSMGADGAAAADAAIASTPPGSESQHRLLGHELLGRQRQPGRLGLGFERVRRLRLQLRFR